MDLGLIIAIAAILLIGYGIYRVILRNTIETTESPRDEWVPVSTDAAPMRIDRTYQRPIPPQAPTPPTRPYGAPLEVVRNYTGIRPSTAHPSITPIRYNGQLYYPSKDGRGYVTWTGLNVTDAVILGALGLVAYELLHERPAQAASYGSAPDPVVPIYAEKPIFTPTPDRAPDVDVSAQYRPAPVVEPVSDDVDLSGSSREQTRQEPVQERAPDVDLTSYRASASRDVDVSQPASVPEIDVSRSSPAPDVRVPESVSAPEVDYSSNVTSSNDASASE